MRELEGKCAVITGAGSGMAKAATRAFVREGARVLAVDISGAQHRTAEELGDAVVPFHADVSVEAEVVSMFAAASNAFGRVDAVLNVAGIASIEPVIDISVGEFERIMSVNLLGVMLGTKHGIRTMLRTGGGSVVNWSSTGGINASPRSTSVYSASKAGVIAVTKAAAVEYATQGIRANTICPGFIETELSAGWLDAAVGCPMKRAGRPEDVAELACFLASDRAPFLTGAVIPVDGGLTALLP